MFETDVEKYNALHLFQENVRPSIPNTRSITTNSGAPHLSEPTRTCTENKKLHVWNEIIIFRLIVTI